MSSVNIQSLTPTGNQVQDIQNLFDAYARLRKELVHGLSFLDEENVPVLKTIVGDIEGAYTAIVQTQESIDLLATDVAGNTSAISVQAGQIQSLVTSVNGQASSITQLSNEISLKVSNSQYTASVIVDMINNGSVTISANKINLVGAVSVLSDISGNLGTITAGNIDINEDVKVGDRIYLSATNYTSGVYWGEAIGAPNISYDPSAGMMWMFALNGVASTKAQVNNLRVLTDLNLTGATVTGLYARYQ